MGPDGDIATLRRELEQTRAELELLRRDREAAHAQRRDSLAMLAGTIAHDFNNLLATILGYASLANLPSATSEDARTALENVCRAAEHAAGLTRQLLAYAGKGRFEMRPIELSTLVRGTTKLLESSLPKHVALRSELGAKGERVLGDETQLQQMLMNLVANAADAIGERRGAITLSTARRELDGEQLASRYGAPALRPGPYLSIEIADDGCGMSADMLGRIFDPFFTTKKRGAGLGLAAVLGIVTGHGGALRVDSELGQGTVVQVVLPTTEERRAEAPARERSEPQVGTVLVVEDEVLVSMMAQHVLQRAGFSVLTAADGKEALELYRAHAVDLVLLDLTMPVMDGAQTFEALRALDPDVRVLMTSGYNEDDTMSRVTGPQLVGFVRKPYRADLLASEVRRALASRTQKP